MYLSEIKSKGKIQKYFSTHLLVLNIIIYQKTANIPKHKNFENSRKNYLHSQKHD